MMRRVALAICRWSLAAYPASFRREYGTAWTQAIDDLHHHTQMSTPRLVRRVCADVLLTAPKMRLETLMGPPQSPSLPSPEPSCSQA